MTEVIWYGMVTPDREQEHESIMSLVLSRSHDDFFWTGSKDDHFRDGPSTNVKHLCYIRVSFNTDVDCTIPL